MLYYHDTFLLEFPSSLRVLLPLPLIPELLKGVCFLLTLNISEGHEKTLACFFIFLNLSPFDHASTLETYWIDFMEAPSNMNSSFIEPFLYMSVVSLDEASGSPYFAFT